MGVGGHFRLSPDHGAGRMAMILRAPFLDAVFNSKTVAKMLVLGVSLYHFVFVFCVIVANSSVPVGGFSFTKNGIPFRIGHSMILLSSTLFFSPWRLVVVQNSSLRLACWKFQVNLKVFL